MPLTVIQQDDIIKLAKKIYNAGILASQNAALGHERAVNKYEDEAEKAFSDLKDYVLYEK